MISTKNQTTRGPDLVRAAFFKEIAIPAGLEWLSRPNMALSSKTESPKE
jgi:hypothetical protein